MAYPSFHGLVVLRPHLIQFAHTQLSIIFPLKRSGGIIDDRLDTTKAVRMKSQKILSLTPDGRLALTSKDGKQQAISTTEPSYRVLTAYLLLDRSASMAGEKLNEAKEGAVEFGRDAIQRGYAVGLIAFGSDADVLCKPSANINTIREAITNLGVAGSTNMTAAIQLAVEDFVRLGGDRTIVLVTDGEPNDAAQTIDAANAAKAAGVHILTIGVEGADISFLESIRTQNTDTITAKADDLRKTIRSAAERLPLPRG